jgi:hypothetical protein
MPNLPFRGLGMKTNAISHSTFSTTATGFRQEYLDFRRGIHVGNLEENERITRILKLALEARYRQGFVTERWGRGVYWQWIGFLARADREAKPLSSHVSFGCSKFFISVETDEKLFKCGLQVERGYVKAPRESRECELCSDWDWHRLIENMRSGSLLDRELRRLILREGFSLLAGGWDADATVYTKQNYPGVRQLSRVLTSAPGNHWAGFQLYFPMKEEEVRSATGADLVDSMLAVFGEVTPLMNLTMQVELHLSL